MSLDFTGKRFSLSVIFNTVSIEIKCSDEYEAQVLFDDLTECMQSGQAITMTPGKPKEQPK